MFGITRFIGRYIQSALLQPKEKRFYLRQSRLHTGSVKPSVHAFSTSCKPLSRKNSLSSSSQTLTVKQRKCWLGKHMRYLSFSRCWKKMYAGSFTIFTAQVIPVLVCECAGWA